MPIKRYQHLSELYHAQEKRLFKLAQRIKGPSFDKYAYSPSQAIDALEAAIWGEQKEDGIACRAAMQAEPVTAANTLSGWMLVPVEPTEQMIMAAGPNCPDAYDYLLVAYKEMLAAAPEQEDGTL